MTIQNKQCGGCGKHIPQMIRNSRFKKVKNVKDYCVYCGTDKTNRGRAEQTIFEITEKAIAHERKVVAQ